MTFTDFFDFFLIKNGNIKRNFLFLVFYCIDILLEKSIEKEYSAAKKKEAIDESNIRKRIPIFAAIIKLGQNINKE